MNEEHTENLSEDWKIVKLGVLLQKGTVGKGIYYVLNASPNASKNKKEGKMTEKTIKSGPMRAIRVHHPVHGHLHGLTRQRGRGAQGFKSFHGNKSTFTDHILNHIVNLIRIEYNPKIMSENKHLKIRKTENIRSKMEKKHIKNIGLMVMEVSK